MDKAITIKRINQGWDSFVLKDNKLEPYTLNSGEISKAFNIQKLMNDNQYFEEVYNQGYKWHRKVFWTKNYNLHYFYIPITRNFVEYYSLNWNTGDYKGIIVLSDRDLNNNIDSLISISLIIDVHLQVLIDKLYRIEKYINENLSRCVNIKGVEILVYSTLQDLYKIKEIDVRQEIAAFKKLKRKIQIRKTKIMIKNLFSPS